VNDASDSRRANPLLLLGIGLGAGILISVAVGRLKPPADAQKGAADAGAPIASAALPSASAAIPEPMFTVSATPLGGTRARPWETGGDAGAQAAAANEKSIRDERAILEGVRAALDKGDGAKALAQLDKHDREFPGGLFGPESRILRIEALSVTGKEGDALASANEFLESYPHSPQADRVRSMASKLRARDPGK
jgi:hypothetical protein